MYTCKKFLKKDGRKVRKAAKNEIFILKMWVHRAPWEFVFVSQHFFSKEQLHSFNNSAQLNLMKKKKCKMTFVGKLYSKAVTVSGAFLSCFRADAAVWPRQGGEKSRDGPDVLKVLVWWSTPTSLRYKQLELQAEFLNSRPHSSVMCPLWSIICNLLKALLFGINNSTSMSICSKALWNKQQGWQKTKHCFCWITIRFVH